MNHQWRESNSIMFDHVRAMISQGYDLLESAPMWARIREANIKNSDPAEEFLKIAKEISSLKGQLRSRLYETSNTLEKMEGVYAEFGWIVEREKMRGKYKNTKFN